MHLYRPFRRFASLSPGQALITSAVLAVLAVPTVAQLQFEELPGHELPVDNQHSNAVAMGDVDGDGDLDMVIGNVGQNRLYLNNGFGSFADVTATQMPVDVDLTRAVTLADVDGDGDLDMVVGNGGDHYVNFSAAQNRLYINDGVGSFSDATALQMPVAIGDTTSVVLGDVDGDGDLDLVCGNGVFAVPLWCSTYGLQNWLYLNDGTGSFSDATATQMAIDADPTEAVVLGDVDGDGDLDLAVGNSFYLIPQWAHCLGGYPVKVPDRLYLNDGAGAFTAASFPLDTDVTYSVAFADIEGDGDLDLVVGSTWAGDNRLYVNSGSGAFTNVTATQMPAASRGCCVLGDVDGDGDLDMILGGGGQNQLSLNDGNGTFVDVTGIRMQPYQPNPENTLAIAVGDVDGDGDLDAVFGNRGGATSGQNRLKLNLQRQLHAPTSPQIGQVYSLDAYMRYGTSTVANFAVTYLSTAPASIASLFGTIGLDLAAAVPFPTTIVPQPVGVGSVGFTVPNAPSLVGQPIYCQSMLIAYPFDLRLSNVVADVIQ